MENLYLDLLAQLGVSSAHPGGFSLTTHLLSYLPLSSQCSVLDAGCGTGRTAINIANKYGCHTVAIDLNPTMIAKAKQNILRECATISLLQGTVEALPFNSGTFDVVLSESVIAFTNVQQTIAELRRVLRPGGYLACIEMCVERQLRQEEQDELRSVYGTKEFLTSMQWYYYLQQSGFSDIRMVEGSTIATMLHSAQEVPSWDVSPSIPPSYMDLLEKHEKIIAKYQHVLGHRSFLCKK
ncbi:class I SAM-dependent methyltransferase [Ectobacillus sp. sgz5001026]|uniref:class I SAM-dependent methyltransferase n=1 Tax=Ectobacillus sp. sgz5001026 TaxID=3242473 RepID=UPI0036D3E34D